MSVVGKVAAGILAVIVFVAIVVGGYNAGWWLKKDQTNRQVKIDNQQLGTQTAWADEVRSDIKDAALLPEGPQRQVVVNEACELIPRLTETFLTPEIETFQMENC